MAARLLAAERDLGRAARPPLRVRRLHQPRRRARSRPTTSARFDPGVRLAAPRTAVATWALAADTEEEAWRADRLEPHGDGDAAPRPADRRSRRSSRRCASSSPRARRSSAARRRITAGHARAGPRRARDDRAAVRRRRGDRRHDHVRPRRAAALLRAAGRGVRARAAALPRRPSRRRARAPRRRRRSSRAPRRRRRGPPARRSAACSFVAPSSSSSTRVLGSWATSALSTSIPASSSAARTAVEVGRLAGDLEHVVVGADVLGAGVDRDHQVVLGVALASRRRRRPSCRTGRRRSPGSPRLPSCLVNAWRTSEPVRLRLSVVASTSSATPPGAVALVGDGLERVGVAALAGALGDRALDVVLRHRRVLGLLHGQRERRVALDVAAALLRRHRDGARELGEELAAAGVDDRLLVLDPRPLGMTGHGGRVYFATQGARPAAHSSLSATRVLVGVHAGPEALVAERRAAARRRRAARAARARARGRARGSARISGSSTKKPPLTQCSARGFSWNPVTRSSRVEHGDAERQLGPHDGHRRERARGGVARGERRRGRRPPRRRRR